MAENNRPLRVLITHERFPPDFGGGGEIIVWQTARNLQKAGIDVRVLTMRVNGMGGPQSRSYEGVPVTRLAGHRYAMNLAVRSIATQARGVDLIHTFNYHACLPSYIAGGIVKKPVVCTILGLFQDAWLQMRGPLAGRLWILWERFLLTRPYDRTVFLSEFSKEQGIALGVPASRALANPPGVEGANEFPQREKDNVVLFAGKLEARKGVEDLLAVARELPQIRFRIAGWGPEEANMRARAPSNVEWLGFLDGDAMKEAYARSSIFFFPSLSETFGMVIPEAMAARCAIVSTVPLSYEGAMIRAGDRAAMIEALRRLWSDPAGTREIGEKNRLRALEYTWDRYTNVLQSIYRDVLRGKSL